MSTKFHTKLSSPCCFLQVLIVHGTSLQTWSMGIPAAEELPLNWGHVKLESQQVPLWRTTPYVRCHLFLWGWRNNVWNNSFTWSKGVKSEILAHSNFKRLEKKTSFRVATEPNQIELSDQMARMSPHNYHSYLFCTLSFTLFGWLSWKKLIPPNTISL